MATTQAEAPDLDGEYKTARLYLLLSNNGAMTSVGIADMMGIGMTETYNLLSILKDRELIMAIPITPIKFVAVPSGADYCTTIAKLT